MFKMNNNKHIILIAMGIIAAILLTSCGKQDNSYKSNKVIDLTDLNDNAVYAAVTDIVSSPKENVGKKIKLNGYFITGKDGKSQETYCFCVVKDAMECCEQGMEIKLKDSESYPEEGTRIQVQGIFSEHKEGKNKFYRLDDVKLEELKDKGAA